MMKFSASNVLHPGLVFIPNMLTQNEQQCLANIQNLELIRSKNRIRMYNRLTKYPEIHNRIHQRYIQQVFNNGQ